MLFAERKLEEKIQNGEVDEDDDETAEEEDETSHALSSKF